MGSSAVPNTCSPRKPGSILAPAGEPGFTSSPPPEAFESITTNGRRCWNLETRWNPENLDVPLRPFGEVFLLHPRLCGFRSLPLSGLLLAGPSAPQVRSSPPPPPCLPFSSFSHSPLLSSAGSHVRSYYGVMLGHHATHTHTHTHAASGLVIVTNPNRQQTKRRKKKKEVEIPFNFRRFPHGSSSELLGRRVCRLSKTRQPER